MIEFPCRCGHMFRLDDDQAGGLVQCPQCRLLNDVPTHGDQGQLARDGTYEVGPHPERRDPDEVVADLAYIYQKGVRDAEGNEIDLRLSHAEIAAVGGEPIPLSPDDPPRKHAPRYDPETGELIAPLEISRSTQPPPINPGDIPMAKPALNYATRDTARSMSFSNVFLRLLSLPNIAVMVAVFFMHAMLWPLLAIPLVGIVFFVIANLFIDALILAHYGNVIEDVGPFEKDELPRPLRDLDLYGDVWAPFCSVFGSMLICFAPALLLAVLVLRISGAASLALGAGLVALAIGIFYLPAVLLTLQASGTILNLRPDRVLAVIGACGKDYVIVVVVWVFALLFYLWGWMGTTLAAGNLLTSGPSLVIGIFLMHYFCVMLGMLYRVHYDQFPWILQRHISTRKYERTQGVAPTGRRVRPVRPTNTDRT